MLIRNEVEKMSKFFALMSRMKYIERWGLMRSTRKENIQEHSLQTAMIAHALALIGNKMFNKNYDADSIAVKAMYHEASEILTGDLPTPIKYYNDEIRASYKKIEEVATNQVLEMLPNELKEDYLPILSPLDKQEKTIIKAADKICAYLKCVEEVNAGNNEFADALESLEANIKENDLEEVKYFINNFVAAFDLTLDKLR